MHCSALHCTAVLEAWLVNRGRCYTLPFHLFSRPKQSQGLLFKHRYPFPPLTLHCCHTKSVRDILIYNWKSYVALVMNILNCQNCSTDSKASKAFGRFCTQTAKEACYWVITYSIFKDCGPLPKVILRREDDLPTRSQCQLRGSQVTLG